MDFFTENTFKPDAPTYEKVILNGEMGTACAREGSRGGSSGEAKASAGYFFLVFRQSVQPPERCVDNAFTTGWG